MYPLFETVCVKEGQLLHKKWHEWRYRSSYLQLFGKKAHKSLLDDIQVPKEFGKGHVKLRVDYNDTEKKIEFSHYQIAEVTSLKIIQDHAVSYELKYADRKDLNELFKKKGACDDFLLVKNGVVTDTSYCNIVFFDGNEWLTPQTPLLKGTARQRLIYEGVIREQEITVNDLNFFTHFKLINAMRDFHDVPSSPVLNIVN